ncbi:MAG: hypothetical protein KJ062_04695 [Thermoanaerobaculia bacterium]|nr:hypothetical protein [Thermoanaerobaculia bacterium]
MIPGSAAQLVLTLTEADFPPEIGAAVRTTVLDRETGSPLDALREALPAAVAKKISAMVPDGFQIDQLEFSLNLGGAPFGIGVSGEVRVVLRPGS